MSTNRSQGFVPHPRQWMGLLRHQCGCLILPILVLFLAADNRPTGLLNKKAVSHAKLASSKCAEAKERDERKLKKDIAALERKSREPAASQKPG